MSVDASLVVDAATRVFRELANPRLALRGADWQAPFWAACREVGLPVALAPEACGGSGTSLAEGFGVFRAAGRSALAMPLVETMLANWVLGAAGLEAIDAPLALLPSRPRDVVRIDEAGTVHARALHVPFASGCSHLVFVDESGGEVRVAVLAREQCQILGARCLAGDALDAVSVHGVRGTAHATIETASARDVLMLGATARAMQMAGALETMLTLSVAYTHERVAFGKAISKFQAVQQNLARMGGEVAAAIAVAESAADAMAHRPAAQAELLLEVASAKSRCGEAVEAGAAIAHQMHGAIGFSEEHVLHRYSLRALAWRDDFGHESHWQALLGAAALDHGGAALWPLLAAR